MRQHHASPASSQSNKLYWREDEGAAVGMWSVILTSPETIWSEWKIPLSYLIRSRLYLSGLFRDRLSSAGSVAQLPRCSSVQVQPGHTDKPETVTNNGTSASVRSTAAPGIFPTCTLFTTHEPTKSHTKSSNWGLPNPLLSVVLANSGLLVTQLGLPFFAMRHLWCDSKINYKCEIRNLVIIVILSFWQVTWSCWT